MRTTNDYTGSQYARDNGFPLVWIARLFMKRAQKGASEEADEHFAKSNAQRKGKIIGRVAGADAYTGASATRYKERNSGNAARGQQQKDDDETSKSRLQASANEVDVREKQHE